MEVKRWYIDSWCVLDGIAFASFREPFDEGSVLPSTDTTVMIAPPDWRAVSIGRLSTALAAARGPFQESVVDDNENELPFPSLDAIRDVVRRAYLAGGLGFDGPGGAETVPAPRGGEGPSPLVPETWFDFGEEDRQKTATVTLLKTLVYDHDAKHLFLDTVTSFARAVDVWADAGRGKWEDLVAWLLAESSMTGDYAKIGPPLGYYPYPALSPQLQAGRPPRTSLLFRLPAILTQGVSHLPKPRTLADQLLMSLASRREYGARKRLDQFMPLVVASAVLSAGARPDYRFGTSLEQRLEELLYPALRWLAAEQMTWRVIEDDSIEQMIEKLIVDIAEHKLGSAQDRTPIASFG